jgi:hypothetical protein
MAIAGADGHLEAGRHRRAHESASAHRGGQAGEEANRSVAL